MNDVQEDRNADLACQKSEKQDLQGAEVLGEVLCHGIGSDW
jgi:hypothetical protein